MRKGNLAGPAFSGVGLPDASCHAIVNLQVVDVGFVSGHHSLWHSGGSADLEN